MSLRELLELASHAVTVIGLPFALWVFLFQQRAERENEEEEAYLHLADAYNKFLEVVLAHSDLQLRTQAALHDPTPRAARAHADHLRHAGQPVRARLPGRPQAAHVGQPSSGAGTAGTDYMREWCRREDFAQALPQLLRRRGRRVPCLHRARGRPGTARVALRPSC
jgi:hypothetical protein